ncbi:unnamed protein product [Chondrus crispus]|uniref:Large ribosomal subunit protein uL1c n=1 Tax=Chondrus crispus TaxID=2769 RepID=R7QM01_CHOCR|nr:unnamed protein product [Chondrus crispus]CDF38813.1 unnamed protein product [Chondrus crispus]|eukprot:XP_005718718.1 unnamed protein product [Chondrus crispus]
MLRHLAARFAFPARASPRAGAAPGALSSALRRRSSVSAEPPGGAAAPPPPPSAPSRWQRLKRKRRAERTPANRTAYRFDRAAPAPLPAALAHVRAAAWAAFDESLELVLRLNIDPRKAAENIRGAALLPHGTGRPARVAAFAEGIDADAARAAGADRVGADDLVAQIAADRAKSLKGFHACVAVPELLPTVAARVGMLLGPKGLMPAKKDGTVGPDVAQIVTRLKSGQIRFRTDRAGNVHLIVGKLSFADHLLIDNVCAATAAIMDARPHTVKKKYLEKAFLCSSMGPSVKLDLVQLARAVNDHRG